MNNNDNKVMLYVVIGVIIFFVVVMPFLDNLEKLENLENTNNENVLDNKECSQSCCKFNQWLPPELQNNDPKYKDYIGSNMSCNNGSGGGCVCMKQSDLDTLSARDGNKIKSCNN